MGSPVPDWSACPAMRVSYMVTEPHSLLMIGAPTSSATIAWPPRVITRMPLSGRVTQPTDHTVASHAVVERLITAPLDSGQ